MLDLPSALADLTSAATRCAEIARTTVSDLPDDALLEHQRALAESARFVDLAAAAVAAEVAHRSRRELEYSGLAQRKGARTPEALVQAVTGTSSSTARRLVRVGTMMAQAAAHDVDPTLAIAEPWLAPALAAASTGAISAEAVEVIRAGLVRHSGDASPDALADAARRLAGEAREVTIERLASRARELCDQLDGSGVALREQERRDRRYLRLFPQLDGMTRIVGLLDPESAAVVINAVDVATSPRRGGPRFVDPTDIARAQRIVDDERTTEQLALDAVVELIDLSVRLQASSAPAPRRADVRVLVTLGDLDRRKGVGYIEGQTASVSIATVERHACAGGLVPILFDKDARAMNLGRTQRLHSARQRIAIAARDGGCLIPECDRPPSWSEVHHIEEFSKGGKTDVADGVLLCRHHHMLVHNNDWRVSRSGSRYSLIPPPGIDPIQTPIHLQPKGPAVRRLLATA
ncbi:MAG: hypothetical protein JWP85_716 [Rhodoglobus sp.]|nr:hypothetical protein [Rhodoglobus sp.]